MSENDCKHDKIQVIRHGRVYVWSCSLCGNEMAKWDKKVWDTLGMDQIAEGEGFKFRITQKGDVDESDKELVA